jgi:hypothetical protein
MDYLAYNLLRKYLYLISPKKRINPPWSGQAAKGASMRAEKN